MSRVDLCILGAGPAGYVAAMRAHDLGKRVVLVERDRVGGAGIHEGALSSKTMWHLSNDYAGACRTDRGFRAASVELSYRAVMDSVNSAVAERRHLLERQLDALTEPSPTGGIVQVVRGTGRFISPHAVEVAGADGSLRRIEADYFLIATGSKPRLPADIDVDGDRIVTSDQIEHWPGFPASMVVVGAGVIGCEYATVFGNFGQTKIHLIDRAPRILPFEDEDVAAVITRNYERMGLRIHGESKLESLRNCGDHVEFVVTSARGTETVKVERALVSVGRIPNTRDLGLAEIGVALRPDSGVIVTDTQTSVPHIYAAGDTTMDIALVNVAEMEGRHAVEHMFGLPTRPIRYEALSSIMFLSPEVAAVGLNEQQARAARMPYRVAKVANQLINRNIAMRSTGGFIKLLAEHGDHGRILGLRVVGPQASSCIQGIAFLIDQGGGLEDIDRCVHPHPAVTEGVQECARTLLGRSVHKASVFGPDLLWTDYVGFNRLPDA